VFKQLISVLGTRSEDAGAKMLFEIPICKSPDRAIADRELSARATEALKKGGIDTVGQLLEKLNQGDDAVLTITGFGRTSLTAAKKKLRALGYDISETTAA